MFTLRLMEVTVSIYAFRLLQTQQKLMRNGKKLCQTPTWLFQQQLMRSALSIYTFEWCTLSVALALNPISEFVLLNVHDFDVSLFSGTKMLSLLPCLFFFFRCNLHMCWIKIIWMPVCIYRRSGAALSSTSFTICVILALFSFTEVRFVSSWLRKLLLVEN